MLEVTIKELETYKTLSMAFGSYNVIYNFILLDYLQ